MVLIPAGPDTIPDFLYDTINSINYHIKEENCKIAIIDDTGSQKLEGITEMFAAML